ncbi:MAG: hypothetical protein A2V67_04285 [Deltaproteobacteria bacterium RBG_13_61_14]|nr:MAG: hypothetical protein A2V67_04285 [Deltaproteobacteria bacterium RBG_13_61_14]
MGARSELQFTHKAVNSKQFLVPGFWFLVHGAGFLVRPQVLDKKICGICGKEVSRQGAKEQREKRESVQVHVQVQGD